jgi:hypothetical protein
VPVSQARGVVSSLLEMLAGIRDPRGPRGVRHRLVAVLGVATLAGAANYREPGSVAHLLSALARAHPDVAGERVQQCRAEIEAVAEEYMALLEDADVAWEPDPEDAIELEAE